MYFKTFPSSVHTFFFRLTSICAVILVFTSCSLIKTVKLMKAGKTKQVHFKTEVPFEMRMGLIVLKVKVNGVECEYLLDTGAPNVISKELAQKLNLIANTSRTTGDSQGKKSELGFVKINNMTIGGIEFLETASAIADLKQSAEVACLKVDGLLGANLMRKAIWKFDYDKKIITICSSRDSLKIPAEAKTIKFTQAVTGTPLIDVIYNGQTDKNVSVDLGSSGDFNGKTAMFEQLKKSGSLKQITYSFGQSSSGLYGMGAADTTFYTLVSTIKMGGVELTNQIIEFNTSHAKTVGTNYFKNHDLIFDWSKQELLLIAKSPYNNPLVKKFSFGLAFRDNKLFVANVNKSNNEEAPELSDQVLSLNGKNYTSCSAEDWCNILYENPLKAKEEINLTVLRAGKEFSYKLKRTALFNAP